MIRQVDAVYEHGVLRPLEPLSLVESQRVTLTIWDPAARRSRLDIEFLERVRAEVSAMPHIPTLEEVQQALSKIPGTLTGDFSAEREDR